MDVWPDKSEAQRILEDWTANKNLRKHAYAVEAAMRAYAIKLGQDAERWGIVGLLHDFDYEKYPDVGDHPFRDGEIPHTRGYGGAVLAYNSTTTFSYCEFGEPPNGDDAYTQTITSGVSEELFTRADVGASSLVPTYNNCKVRGGLPGSGNNALDGPYHDYLNYKPSGSGNTDF